MKIIQEMERKWRDERPLIKNSPEQIIRYLRDEITEAEAELGDPEKLGAELADVILFTCALASNYNIDLELAVLAKLQRNEVKYKKEDFQDGDYEEKRRQARANWTE